MALNLKFHVIIDDSNLYTFVCIKYFVVSSKSVYENMFDSVRKRMTLYFNTAMDIKRISRVDDVQRDSAPSHGMVH